MWSVEDGFIRGLAPAYITPLFLSLIVDKVGIYFDATGPSDLENILNTHAFEVSLLSRATQCIQKIIDHKISKYNHLEDICPEKFGHSTRRCSGD